jgi:hypothetical protein
MREVYKKVVARLPQNPNGGLQAAAGVSPRNPEPDA